MLPLQPSYAIAELATNRKTATSERNEHVFNTTTDPDHFFTESTALQPDPLYMGLREAIADGPIGRFFAWLDARAEVREERERRQTTITQPVQFSPRRGSTATDRDDLAA